VDPRLTPIVWKSSVCLAIVSVVIVTGVIETRVIDIIGRSDVIKPKQHGGNSKDRPVPVSPPGTLVKSTLTPNVAG
jgi:hypothetical protein